MVTVRNRKIHFTPITNMMEPIIGPIAHPILLIILHKLYAVTLSPSGVISAIYELVAGKVKVPKIEVRTNGITIK
jgi:hypothetical protein